MAAGAIGATGHPVQSRVERGCGHVIGHVTTPCPLMAAVNAVDRRQIMRRAARKPVLVCGYRYLFWWGEVLVGKGGIL